MTRRRSWKLKNCRPRGVPCVLFVDDSHWHAFSQLSPLLRREGVRTIRITTEVRAASRFVSFLLFDRHAVIPPQSLVETLRHVLSSENVVDVQFVEALRDPIGDAIRYMPSDVAEQVERRVAAMDKLWMSKRCGCLGIHVSRW